MRNCDYKRQRERHQTKSLTSRTLWTSLRYNSWYISLPSSLISALLIILWAILDQKQNNTSQKLIFKPMLLKVKEPANRLSRSRSIQTVGEAESLFADGTISLGVSIRVIRCYKIHLRFEYHLVSVVDIVCNNILKQLRCCCILTPKNFTRNFSKLSHRFLCLKFAIVKTTVSVKTKIPTSLFQK